MATELDNAKYISFITYKKDGTAVPTPVWVVPFEGGYAFTTEDTAFKVKRVRNNPAAAAKVCSLSGKVKADATEFAGTAEVLAGEAAARVSGLIKRKYWLAYSVAIAPGQLWRRLRGSGPATHTAVKFTVTA
ncbi:MAG: PPOX class F420-dependent oxidoreductase [Actinomycetota bacterium]|nr:PPOX class F420-dependent oxidoreductase [Actinomycetota bacterium]